MTKQIQVSDELHAQLKKEAERNYRSIGSHIEYLLAMEEDREVKAYEAKAMAWMKSKGMVWNADTKQYEPDTSQVPDEVIADAKKLAGASPKNPLPSTRGMGDVLSDIQLMERERDDRLMYCQDEEVAASIRGEYTPILDGLWREYKELKGSE